MAQGSGGYGGPNFAQIEHDLRNVALQFASIVSAQQQLMASVTAWRMLEREIALAQAAAGGTAAEFTKMEMAARNFALASSYNSAQVANSLYNLASAGLSVTQSLQAATGTILLAQATMTDLGEASDIVASTMSQFGLQASEAYRVSNLFVASTNASLSTVPKLAFALRQVGPIAAQANLSLEDTVGILDKLFDAGLRGEQAGTALRNSIVRLTNPVGEGGKVLRNLGVEFYDKQTGAARGYLEILKDMSKLNLSNTSLAQIFGTEAMAGAAAQLKAIKDSADGSTDALTKHIKEISNTDWAYRQAVVQMNTLDGAMSIAANNANELRTIIGKGLAPVVIDLSQWFGNLVADFRNLSTEQLASIAHTGLMIAQMGVLARGFGAIQPAVMNFAQGGRNVRDAWSAMQLATSAGAGTVTQRLGMATEATGYLARGFTSIASAAMGLAGIAVTLYGIKKAMDAVNDAQDKARIASTTKNILTSVADKTNVPKAQREAFTDTTSFAQGYVTNLSRIDGMFQVDNQSGSGAFQRVRALSVEIERGQAEIANLDKQIAALQGSGEKVRQNFKRAADVIATMYDKTTLNQGFSMSGPSAEAATVYSVASIFDGQKQAMKLVDDNLNDLIALGDSNVNNVKGKVAAYVRNRIEAVKTLEGVSSTQKLELVMRYQNMGKQFAAQDEEALVKFTQEASKAASAGRERIETVGLDRKGGIGVRSAATTIGNILDEINTHSQEQLDLSAEKLQQLIDNRKADRDRILAAMKNAKTQDANSDALLSKEAVGFLTNGLNPGVADEIKKFVATAEGKQVLDDAIKAMRTEHLSMQEFVDRIAKGIGQNRRQLADQLNRQVADQMGAIPMFDAAKLEHDTQVIRTQQKEQMLRYVELTGGKYDVKLAQEIINDKRHYANEEDVSQLFREFAGGSADLQNRIANWAERNPQGSNNIMHALESYANGQKSAAEAAADALEKSGDLAQGGAPREILRRAFIKYAEKLKLNALEARNDGREAIQKAERSNTRNAKEGLRTDPTQNYVNELLGLPTAEEMYLRNQQVLIEARYAMSQYLALPTDGLRREMEQQEVKFRQQLSEVQKRFRDVYTKSLAQGADNAVTDTELQDAFSGKFITDVFKNGSGTFNGQNFTRAMLQSTSGMEEYLRVVEQRFSSLVAGSKAAPLRIQKAREQLHGMANELSGLFDQFTADGSVLAFKMEDAQRVADEFMRTFRGEQLVRAFETAGQMQGQSLDLTIDVAIKAKTTQILLDTENAIKQIREKYMAAFQNLNIPVRINAKGEFVPVTLSDTAGPAGVTAAAADPQVIAKATAAAVIASVGAYRSPVGGRRSSNYGIRNDPFTGEHRFHNGVDFAAPRGTVVSAAYGGRVTYAGNKGDGYGNKVVVDMGNGETTFYAHLESIAVKMGQVLEQGVRVGTVGSTGRSTGPHLHFGGSKNGKSADPRTLGGGKRTVTGEAQPEVEAGQQVVDVQQQQVKLTEDQIKLRDQLIAEYNREADTYREIQRQRIEFITDEKNKTLIALSDILRARKQVFDATTGSVFDTKIDVAKLRQRGSDQLLQSQTYGFTSGAAGASQVRDAFLANETNKNEIERLERLKEVAEVYELQRSRAKALGQDVAGINENEREANELINREYDERNALIGSNIEKMRESADLYAKMLEAQANRNGNGTDNVMLGLRASVADFAAQIPTLFETAKQGATMVLQGIADVGSSLFANTETNAKQAVAGILRSIAQLIAKMLIMYATLQLIRLIPGGSALLSALDFGSNLGGAKASGGTGGLPATQVAALGGIGGNFVRMFAYGGVDGAMFGFPGAPILTQGERSRGGVRRPYNPAVSIHGEGQHPEAYIPMVDRRTIPMIYDAQGKAWVPLPSGQMIPVSVKNDAPRKYETGGIGGNVTGYDKARALLADQRMSGKSSKSISAVGRKGGGDFTQTNSTHLEFAPVIQLSGGATGDDADMLINQMLPALNKLLDQRDADNARKAAIARASIQSGYN